MGKRWRSSAVRAKKQKSGNCMEDRISQLPDGILVSVLSHLTMGEAARTSILSRRWTYLWTFITGSLNFDGMKAMWKIAEKRKLLKVETSKFVNWVNHVCKLHQGPTLDEFRVRFQVHSDSACNIDEWIDFAVTKKVQKLELDFSPKIGGFPKASLIYTLPLKCSIHIKSPCGLSFINSLTSLCLKFINVTGELLEYFLANCAHLGRLCVKASKHLINLRIAGSSLQLKYLEISQCYCLESVEISAPNLVELKYIGPKRILHIKDAPLLVDVSVGGGYEESRNYALVPLSSYLLQLETLNLELDLIWGENLEFPQFPELKNLRHLTWIIHATDRRSLLGLTSMIQASPFLHSFTLQLHWLGWDHREVQNVAYCPNQYLKVVELKGFVGQGIDVELARYLLGSAIMLEKIVIDPRHPLYSEGPWEYKESKEHKRARLCAQQLKPKLPPGAKLIIL